jgi:hypothetical protein
LDHARDALRDPQPSDKLERIREIIRNVPSGPQIIILRHGLPHAGTPAEVASEVEAAIIDVLLRWKVPLTNVVRGANTERGLRSLESLRAELATLPLRLEQPAMLVTINRTWFDGMSEEEVWSAARGWWVAKPEDRSPRPELLLAVADKIVRGAWRLPWEQGVAAVVERRLLRWDELDVVRQAIYGDPSGFDEGVRCRFIGRVPAPGADALIGKHVGALGRSYGGAFRYAP